MRYKCWSYFNDRNMAIGKWFGHFTGICTAWLQACASTTKEPPWRGTGLVFKESINVSQTAAGEKNSFEYAEYHITSKSYQLCLINIYRPPYSDSHPVSVSSFVTEFNDYMKNHLLSNIPILVAGDFNIHVDVSGDSQSFLDLLDSLWCTQLVDFSTHKHGHTWFVDQTAVW